MNTDLTSISPTHRRDSGTPAGWWAVYTRHHHEQAVADVLTAKGVEVLLPTFETARQWKDRKKIIRMPLFPCYLFVRESLGGRLPVLTTPGVHMILSHGERCAIVPDGEIQDIMRAARHPAMIEPHPFLNAGERVRVIRGAMTGVEGVLVRKKSGWRLVISIRLLTQSAAVEVSSLDVEPVRVQPLTTPAVTLPFHTSVSAAL